MMQKDADQILASAIDRMQEAHFWLHSMESHYHNADQFRWCFNSFLRALKEVPIQLFRSLQNHPEGKRWLKENKHTFLDDPLLKTLSKKRDFVVHTSMLLPESSGTVGLTDGSKLRIGMGYKINPLMDSDHAMHDYLLATRDIFGILSEDEDTIPCVERLWKLKEFESELVNLCATAWLKISEAVRQAMAALGKNVASLDLACRHAWSMYYIKTYSRVELREIVKLHKQ